MLTIFHFSRFGISKDTESSTIVLTSIECPTNLLAYTFFLIFIQLLNLLWKITPNSKENKFFIPLPKKKKKIADKLFLNKKIKMDSFQKMDHWNFLALNYYLAQMNC